MSERRLRTSGSQAFDLPYRLCGRQYGDASIVASKAVQIAVAGNNQIGPSGNGTGEHLVVVRILIDYAWHILGSCHVGQTAQFHDDGLWGKTCLG